MAADRILTEAWAIARRAGHEILKHYGGAVAVETKADNSPVTAADRAADALIVPALRRLMPDTPVVSEERVESVDESALGEAYWLVDPLDGTKEFLKRNGEFTVNLALIVKDTPFIGIVHVPATDETYGGVGDSLCLYAKGAQPPQQLATRPAPPDGLTVVSSRSHADDDALASYLGGRRIADRKTAGSSLKFCLIAKGEADLYPRLGPTMEWDTAAGHAVLVGAGGTVVTMEGDPLTYGKPGFRNPHFVASGR